MALPAILANLLEAVGGKIAEAAAARIEVVEKLAGQESVSAGDVVDAARELDDGPDNSDTSRPQAEAPSRRAIDIGEIIIYGRLPAEDDAGETRRAPEEPERRATDPLSPEDAPDDDSRGAAPESSTAQPGPRRQGAIAEEADSGRDAEGRAAQEEPEAEAPLEAEESYEPSSIGTARDAYEVGLRPHMNEFENARRELERQIEEEADADPSAYGVARAAAKQTLLDVMSGAHGYLFGSIESVTRIGEGTAAGLETGDVLSGLGADVLGATTLIPGSMTAKATITTAKGMLAGGRRVMGALKKAEKAVDLGDDAAKQALRQVKPRTAANLKAPAPKGGTGAGKSGKGAAKPAKGQGKPSGGKGPKKSKLPDKLSPDQLKKVKDIVGRNFDDGFRNAWNRAVARSPRAQELLQEAKRLAAAGKHKEAHKAARKAFDNVRGKFWQEVRKSDSLSKRITDAGMEFPKTDKAGKLASTAPSYKTPGGTERLTLEHIERAVDAPDKAIDGKNLLFSLSHENSGYLETLRRHLSIWD